MLTIQDIQKEYVRLGEAIEALQRTRTPVELQPGEHYAGLVFDAAVGIPLHHLVLLPDAREKITWFDAVAWAQSIGGTLPTRQEQALLYANLRRCFHSDWYWSSEPREPDGSAAWLHSFSDCGKYGLSKSALGRARAVRRLPA